VELIEHAASSYFFSSERLRNFIAKQQKRLAGSRLFWHNGFVLGALTSIGTSSKTSSFGGTLSAALGVALFFAPADVSLR
jgi:hypothetical protein